MGCLPLIATRRLEGWRRRNNKGGEEEEKEAGVGRALSLVPQVGRQLVCLRSNPAESHVLDYKLQVGWIISGGLLRERRELLARG